MLNETNSDRHTINKMSPIPIERRSVPGSSNIALVKIHMYFKQVELDSLHPSSYSSLRDNNLII